MNGIQTVPLFRVPSMTAESQQSFSSNNIPIPACWSLKVIISPWKLCRSSLDGSTFSLVWQVPTPAPGERWLGRNSLGLT